MKFTDKHVPSASAHVLTPPKGQSSYRTYVRKKIEAGLADLRASRVHSHASIRREFLRISGN